MGQQIVYCAACGSKILARDFESKAAFRLDSRGFCKACAPDALKSLPPDKLAQVLSQISQAESSASRKSLPAAKPHAPSPVPAVRRQAPEPSRTPLIVAGVAVAAGILGTLLVMTASRPEPLPAPRPPPPVAPDRPAKPDREALAAQALQKARDYRDANPKDVATQIAGYERLASDF